LFSPLPPPPCSTLFPYTTLFRSVPRGVDDVDGEATVGDGRVLGEDRDALLPLKIAGVEHPLGNLRTRPERTGLPQHGVNQRRLRSEEHTSELQSLTNLVCRLLLE